MPIPPHILARRAALAEVAKETKAVLPGILRQLPHVRAAESEVWHLRDLPEIKASTSPQFELASSPSSSSAMAAPSASHAATSHPSSTSTGTKTYGTRVRVLNMDTLDAAMIMAESLTQPLSTTATTPTPTSTTTTNTTTTTATTATRTRNQRVLILNLASERQPGGGWLTGAVAQEEALCYRSSLSLSLHRAYYPLPPLAAVYTRDVVVVRDAMDRGHQLLLLARAAASPVPAVAAAAAGLPVVSALSVAGVRKPDVIRKRVISPTTTSSSTMSHDSEDDEPGDEKEGTEEEEEREARLETITAFRHAADRDLTKAKMRLALRAAAAAGHELLVLGALGCGAFGNPPADVARCWREVLDGEAEFAAGRAFREIWFAVYDRRGEGNFEAFERVFPPGRAIGCRRVVVGAGAGAGAFV